mgnify:CR=1 FL=1
MKHWKKSDIGKRIIYRDLLFGGKLVDEEVIIYDVNPDVPNTIRFAEYPIIFKPGIDVIQSPISLESKIGLAYAVKSQEKEKKEYLEKVGDWFFVDRVSKDEMWVLDILAKAPKKPLDII